MPKNNFEEGLTLVELLVTLAILFGIAGVGTLIGINFWNGESLQNERYNLVTILRKARSEAMNNINQSAHGVFLTNNSYILFKGASYASRIQEYDETFQIKGSVNLTGLQEIVFQKIEGASNASGTITISNGEKSHNISINYEGRIDW